jgi:hypothetical protein
MSNEGGENVVTHEVHQRKTPSSINAMVGQVRFGGRQLKEPPCNLNSILPRHRQANRGQGYTGLARMLRGS